MDYYSYEYYVKLDDGSYLGKRGAAVTLDEIIDGAPLSLMFDPRAFFQTPEIASLAGMGFAQAVKEEDGIEGVTFSVESIVRYK